MTEFTRHFQQLGTTCPGCFQVLGVDVIVESNYNVRIIEINGLPSMQLSSEETQVYNVSMEYTRMKLKLTRSIVAMVTTDYPSTRHAHHQSPPVTRPEMAALVTASLQRLNILYVPEGCPVSPVHGDLDGSSQGANINVNAATCVDWHGVQYLLALAMEYKVRGGFNLIFPPSGPTVDDAEMERIIRLSSVLLSALSLKCDPLLQSACPLSNFQLHWQIHAIVRNFLNEINIAI